MITSILDRTSEKLTALGHKVEWIEIGDALARGICSLCGDTVNIESKGGSYRAFGPMAAKVCSGNSGQDR